MAIQGFKALGKKNSEPSKDLETFPAPDGVDIVTFTAPEFTSMCPVTGQPDYSTIIITYVPDGLCLESKSLKLYLQTFRNEGIFCEALAGQICKDLAKALEPVSLDVTVKQNARGGISLEAESHFYNGS